jgi:hypothetical protein
MISLTPPTGRRGGKAAGSEVKNRFFGGAAFRHRPMADVMK